MSKQLKSILDKLPHATVTTPPPSPTPVSLEKESLNRVAPRENDKLTRIVAPVPTSLKHDMKRYIIDHPGETEKSLILKGLRTMGFSILDEYIDDQRKNKK